MYFGITYMLVKSVCTCSQVEVKNMQSNEYWGSPSQGMVM